MNLKKLALATGVFGVLAAFVRCLGEALGGGEAMRDDYYRRKACQSGVG